MQIDVTGQNVEVTQALRAYVTEKMERLDRHFGNLIGGHVVLRLERIEHLAEGTVAVGGRTKDIHAEAVDEDMYAAIDKMTDKLDRQVRRHKQKVTNHRAERPTEPG
ncbi:MAG: ribosome-associated translation inhibitor RaiA [Wenzhouxiangellaceae bacterium]|nr:ribosome-associated translation inhibitor RaiA [Wenzhouxiangellaceae bacterium]